ncbi:MAG: cyd operon YbgE family protein [Sphaerotilus sulfidivorans]|jgi:predicted membrane protein|uniref:cyd operon YbgE family protein n=1 Tax=Sphaerotilus sulfidivorans TaxID=639200 RepID=UPI003F373EC5
MNTVHVPVPTPSRIQWPSLTVALLIMVGGTLYPPLMADAAGKADHDLAMALFWAMSAGFVRGVGFVPRRRIWRVIFSGWACAGALLLASMLKLQH